MRVGLVAREPLEVLEGAGLVTTRREGRYKFHHVDTSPLRQIVERWPTDIGHIDLGGRIVDVIPIPGHNDASIALYDGATGLLLTGDSFYPGRLYVSDFAAFVASNQRLVDFTRTRPVSHILGTHVEQSRMPFVDYPRGTAYQPDEHVLELSRGDLLELTDILVRAEGKPDKIVLRDMTVVPRR